MSDADKEVFEQLVKRWPSICTVEQARDFLDWHVQAGRGGYNLFLRGNWACLPPNHCTHDDEEKAVFLQAL